MSEVGLLNPSQVDQCDVTFFFFLMDGWMDGWIGSFYHFIVDDEHVEDGVTVGILQVRIGTISHDEPVTFLLAKAG